MTLALLLVLLVLAGLNLWVVWGLRTTGRSVGGDAKERSGVAEAHDTTRLFLRRDGALQAEVSWHRADAPKEYVFAGETYRRDRITNEGVQYQVVSPRG